MAWKDEVPVHLQDTEDAIQPQYAIRLLYEMTKGEAIITTGVGQHQMWAGQFYDFQKPRTFLTSAGLGSMGFGYPGGAWREGGDAGQGGDRHRRRRLVPDEHPGTGHGARREESPRR